MFVWVFWDTVFLFRLRKSISDCNLVARMNSKNNESPSYMHKLLLTQTAVLFTVSTELLLKLEDKQFRLC